MTICPVHNCIDHFLRSPNPTRLSLVGLGVLDVLASIHNEHKCGRCDCAQNRKSWIEDTHQRSLKMFTDVWQSKCLTRKQEAKSRTSVRRTKRGHEKELIQWLQGSEGSLGPVGSQVNNKNIPLKLDSTGRHASTTRVYEECAYFNRVSQPGVLLTTLSPKLNKSNCCFAASALKQHKTCT